LPERFDAQSAFLGNLRPQPLIENPQSLFKTNLRTTEI